MNHKSYNISSGCFLNDLNYSNYGNSGLLCSGRNNDIIFGLISGLILFVSVTVGIPILYYIILTIFTIYNEVYESFKNTKENMTISELSEEYNIKLNIVEFDNVGFEFNVNVALT